MNKAQRIHMVQSISNILIGMDPISASLILHQYGWYSENFFGDNSRDNQRFLISFLSNVGDEDLSELYNYLAESFIPGGSAEIEVPDENRVKLFITHLESNRQIASVLKDNLAIEGVMGFVAHEDIPDTEEWRRSLKLELATSHALLVVITNGIENSFWCQQEIGWALGRDIPIVGVNFAPKAPSVGFLSDFQFIPGNIAMLEIVSRIVTALKKNAKIDVLLREHLIQSFINSYSFNRTRSLLPRIKDLESVTDSEKNRILEAFKTNVDLSEAEVSGQSVLSIVKNLFQR